MAQAPLQQQQQQQQAQPGGQMGGQPLPLIPNTLDEHGLMDSNWFKVVITKCPTGTIKMPSQHNASESNHCNLVHL